MDWSLVLIEPTAAPATLVGDGGAEAPQFFASSSPSSSSSSSSSLASSTTDAPASTTDNDDDHLANIAVRLANTRTISPDFNDTAGGDAERIGRRLPTGRRKKLHWTTQEHALFLLGLETLGRGHWVEVAALVETRTTAQVRSHAKRFFKRQRQGGRRNLSINDLNQVEFGEAGDFSIKISPHSASTSSSASLPLPLSLAPPPPPPPALPLPLRAPPPPPPSSYAPHVGWQPPLLPVMVPSFQDFLRNPPKEETASSLSSIAPH